VTEDCDPTGFQREIMAQLIPMADSVAMGVKDQVIAIGEIMDKHAARGPLDFGFVVPMTMKSAERLVDFAAEVHKKAAAFGPHQSYYKAAVINEVAMVLIIYGVADLLVTLQAQENDLDALRGLAERGQERIDRREGRASAS